MSDEDARSKSAASEAATTGNGADAGPVDQAAGPGDPTDTPRETTASQEGREPREATAAEQERLQLRAELAEAKDRWLRAEADLENFKRRAAREKQDALRFGSEHLLKDLLPVIDNLHRALAHAKPDDPVAAGVELVLKGFDEVFERHGVKVVPARGEPFDPNVHEAISHVESEHPANTVIDEHRRGYVLHERLLRPALVTVGKGPGASRDDVAKESTDA